MCQSNGNVAVSAKYSSTHIKLIFFGGGRFVQIKHIKYEVLISEF